MMGAGLGDQPLGCEQLGLELFLALLDVLDGDGTG
jgi:hypothetical protein